MSDDDCPLHKLDAARSDCWIGPDLACGAWDPLEKRCSFEDYLFELRRRMSRKTVTRAERHRLQQEAAGKQAVRRSHARHRVLPSSLRRVPDR